MRVLARAAGAVTLVLAIMLIGCGGHGPDTEGKVLVAASIAPLADFTRNVGGKHVYVEMMVPPGASAHTFEISSAQMKFLSRARLLVLNGVNLEFWAKKAVDAAGNPDLLVLDTSKGIKVMRDAHHLSGNPHVWLDPINAIHQVKAIRDGLIEVDPAHRKDYTRNADRYIKRLRELDSYIRGEVAQFATRGFVSYHATWDYFARRYGLVQAATIERTVGREPTLSELAHVIDAARKLKAKAIFSEPQYSPKAAQVVADEIGAKVLLVDPLGKPPSYDYIRTMRWNIREMGKALK